MTLAVYLASAICFNAYAKVYSKTELSDIIEAVETDALADGLEITRITYAEGIQSYNLQDGTWVATGPLASLYDYDKNTGMLSSKVGTHYQHEKPAWEFFNVGRVIAASAIATPMAAGDVAWLEVTLQQAPDHLGYARIYRVATDGGVKPSDISNYKERCTEPSNKCAYKTGASIGTGYRTLYLFAE